MRTRGLLAGLSLLAVTAACTPDPAANAPSPSSAVRDQVRPGFEDLQARWWNWAAGQPSATNQVTDHTGEFCALDQTGDRWLLAGSFGTTEERTCTVPEGRSLAGPGVTRLVGGESDCRDFLAKASAEVIFDGNEVPLSRVPFTQFALRGVAGNPASSGAGTQLAHGCGLWFEIPHPGVGPHELTIRGQASELSVQVTYHLVVAPGLGRS